MADSYYSDRDVAEILEINRRTLKKYRESGRINPDMLEARQHPVLPAGRGVPVRWNRATVDAVAAGKEPFLVA